MKLIKTTLLFTSLLLLSVVPLRAQDKAIPLLDMLAFVPDTPQVYEGIPVISYADYRAIEAARGVPTPTIQDFTDRSETVGLWIAVSNGLTSGPDFISYVFSDPERTPELIGFSFFDIDRGLVFGNPPSRGTALAGGFDTERITAAYSARDFVQTEIEGVPVWCPPNGCESGLEMSLADRDPADLFGGHLGRKEPLAVLPDGYLANSPDITVVEGMVAAHNGAQPSLAENPFYQAAAEAVAASGVVRQAQIYKWSDLGIVSIFERPETTQQVRDFADSVDPLPAYALAVLADVWDETVNTQIALVGLVYSDADSAETAANVLAGRVDKFMPLRVQQPFTAILADREAEMLAPSVYHSEAAGKWVALLAFSYPTPSNEPREEAPTFVASSLLFRLIVNEIYARGFYLIGTQFDLP